MQIKMVRKVKRNKSGKSKRTVIRLIPISKEGKEVVVKEAMVKEAMVDKDRIRTPIKN